MSEAASAAAAALVGRRWAKMTAEERRAYSRMMNEAKRQKRLGKVGAKRQAEKAAKSSGGSQ